MANDTKTMNNVLEVSARPTARLVIISGAQGKPHPLPDRVCVIGRESSADLQLRGDGISRHHAKIVTDLTGSMQVVDLGAKNGTFVNGQRVTAATLEPGDRIQLGQVLLRFERVEPEQRPRTKPPGLSPRELEVAQLVTRGLTNAEIGSVLGISRATVATHLQRSFERLGLSSRAELASYVSGHDG